MENNRLTPESLKELAFENAYARLTETTARLEQGNLSLEESLSLYEEGVLLSQHCEKLLNNAQLRVSQIMLNGPVGQAESGEEADDELFFDE